MYKLQTYQGTYNKAECLDSNNLIVNLMLHPEIMEDLIFSSQGFSMAFVTHGLGMYGQNKVKQMTHHQRAFEWAVQGRLHRSVSFVRHVSGDGSGGLDAEIIAVLTTDWANPADVIKLDNDQQIYVLGKPSKVADGYQYRFRLNKVSSTDVLATAYVGLGHKGGIIGNKHRNGSRKGWGNVTFPDRFMQWSTISRTGISWDNEAILSVTWFRNPANGKKMWAFEQQKQILDKVIWEMEQDKWYGRMTTFDGGETWMQDDELKDVISGAGYIQQTEGVNSDTYIPGVSDMVAKIKERLGAAILSGSGLTYKQLGVHTGMVHGYGEFHAAMERDFRQGYKTLFYSASAGKPIEVGEEYKSYLYNGIDVVVLGNMIFEDPEIHTNAAINGVPKEAYDMYFMPLSTDGNANVCALTRRSIDGKIDRTFVAKRFKGMIALDGDFSTDGAVTAEDAYGEQYLFEHGVVVLNPSLAASLRAAVAA